MRVSKICRKQICDNQGAGVGGFSKILLNILGCQDIIFRTIHVYCMYMVSKSPKETLMQYLNGTLCKSPKKVKVENQEKSRYINKGRYLINSVTSVVDF